MLTPRSILVVFCTFIALNTGSQGAESQPAMIGQGADSVAARLHYPNTAKASKTEGAVQFYCEVGADGRTRHLRVLAESSWSALRYAVRNAVQQGRFISARVNGKPTSVVIGATVFFLMPKGQPTILVTMATADKTKAAAGVSESKANSGLGAVAIKACEGAKFVPALDNGKPVPGQFNLAVDFAMLVNPDEMAPGSHLKQREE